MYIISNNFRCLFHFSFVFFIKQDNLRLFIRSKQSLKGFSPIKWNVVIKIQKASVSSFWFPILILKLNGVLMIWDFEEGRADVLHCWNKNRWSGNIPCCIESWPYPKQFVGGQGTGALSSARLFQPVELEAYSFPYNQQGPWPCHPMMISQPLYDLYAFSSTSASKCE